MSSSFKPGQGITVSDEPTDQPFDNFQEPRVVAYILDYPQKVKKFLPHLKPELFRSVEVQFVMAFVHNLVAEYSGQIPTRALLDNRITRHLTVDHVGAEEVMKIVHTPADPREVLAIHDDLMNWIEQRKYGLLYSEETIAAVTKRDYKVVREIFAEADKLKAEADEFDCVMGYEEILAYDDGEEEFLVDKVLEPGEFTMILGPLKSMKTSIMLDLVTSLITGRKFLNNFTVPKTVKTMLISGETSKREMKRRMVRLNKGPTADGKLLWYPKKARLMDEPWLAGFRAYLERERPAVVVLDPLYVSVGGMSLNNLQEASVPLDNFKEACLEYGATPVIVHHTNRKQDRYVEPELNHSTGAGAAEYVRQWVLVAHKEPYKSDGVHLLWFKTGGSSGRATRQVLRVDEKDWSLALQDAGAEDVQETKKKAGRREETLGRLVRAVAKLEAAKEPTLKNRIKELGGYSGAAINSHLEMAVEEGLLVEAQEVVGKKLQTVYRTPGRTPSSDAAD